MSNSDRLLSAAFIASSSPRKSIGRRTSFGWLIAATGATLLCCGDAAHSGPCTAQIAQLERQIQRVLADPDSGPTAPQTVEAQLHHQPTPVAVQNAETQGRADADAALQGAQKADIDGNAAACVIALDEAKHHWVLPARLAFDGAIPQRLEFGPQEITSRVAVSFHQRTTSLSRSATARRIRSKHYPEGLVS
jgi:hypothetical protein